MSSLIDPSEDPELFVPLAVVKENEGEVKGKTKFQKLVFLSEMEEDLDTFYQFQKYNHGPYSFDLSDSIETLVSLDLLGEKVTKFRDKEFAGERHEYYLTDKGKELLDNFAESEKLKEIQNGCRPAINSWGASSLNDILDYVYGKYMDE